MSKPLHKIGDLVLYYNGFRNRDAQYALGIIRGIDQWMNRFDEDKIKYSYIVDWCDPIDDIGEYSSETIEEFKADLLTYLEK